LLDAAVQLQLNRLYHTHLLGICQVFFLISPKT
jgi:hypothetical protein